MSFETQEINFLGFNIPTLEFLELEKVVSRDREKFFEYLVLWDSLTTLLSLMFCLFENVRFDHNETIWILLMSRVLHSLLIIHHSQWPGHQPAFQMTLWLPWQMIRFAAICCTWLFHHLCKLFWSFCFQWYMHNYAGVFVSFVIFFIFLHFHNYVD